AEADGNRQPELHECVITILTRVLSCIETTIENMDPEQMKAKMNQLASISKPFEHLLQWCRLETDITTESLEGKWAKLKLWMLCVIATDYHVHIPWVHAIKTNFCFHETGCVVRLLEHIQNYWRGQNEHREQSNNILQWFLQRYVEEFGTQSVACHDPIYHQQKSNLVENLIKVLRNKELIFCIEPNTFTKMHIALQLITSACKGDNIEVLKNSVEGMEIDSEFAVLLMRAQEQYLHFGENPTWKNLHQETKLNIDAFVTASKALSQSAETEDTLNILLKIAECKMWTYHLSHYLSKTMGSTFRYSNNGIEEGWAVAEVLQLRPYLSALECKQIGTMYVLDSSTMRPREMKIRRGLTFYLLTELWRRCGSRAINLLASQQFATLFKFSLEANKEDALLQMNTITEDPFRLLADHEGEKIFKFVDTQFGGSSLIACDWFKRKHFVYMVAGIYFLFVV
ncbi:hypothetical protein RFI_13504, partial [Reticulomyxa filosa]